MTSAQHSNMIKLEHNIYLLDAHYVHPGVACVYLMHRGDEIAIIETGTEHTVPHILNALKSMGCSKEDVRYVIPTHIHLDHAGGAGALMELCPNAQLLVHPRGAPHMIDPSKLQAGTIAVYGADKFNRLYGQLRPVPAERVTEVPDGFELDFNGSQLSFLHTPGHALHHFCIHDSTSGGIFTGDTFGLAYPNLNQNGEPFIFATTTPVHFSPDDMFISIDRLMALEPELMYLTHFGPIEPTSTLVSHLKKSILAFKGIALDEQQNQTDRQAVIEQSLREWLLHELDAEPGGEAENWLENDIQLNAQGLEVWLRRLEKQA
jgi:glyoxylase-like metal-dependent hydrolase (beta-lactamase superfamily II)